MLTPSRWVLRDHGAGRSHLLLVAEVAKRELTRRSICQFDVCDAGLVARLSSDHRFTRSAIRAFDRDDECGAAVVRIVVTPTPHTATAAFTQNSPFPSDRPTASPVMGVPSRSCPTIGFRTSTEQPARNALTAIATATSRITHPAIVID